MAGGRAARIAGAIFALLVLAVASVVAALHFSLLRIPPNWAPWQPVQLDAPPSWLARMQVNSLAGDPEACFAALDRSDMTYRRLDPRPLREGCGMPDGGALVARSGIRYAPAVLASCGVTAALRWYERQLGLLAEAHFGQRLAGIDHLGTYACRNLYARAEGRRSQHATANAIDIAGFRLADGTTVSVRRDWGRDNPRGRFLAAARDEACRFFNAVLGPDYNAAHADHFHLGLGRARICR